MDIELIKKWLKLLDKEIFPDDPAPITVGKTANNAPVQYESYVLCGIPFQKYIISEELNLNRINVPPEITFAVYEVRHRVQNSILEKEFEKWKLFKVKVNGIDSDSENIQKFVDLLAGPHGLHEVDALICGTRATPFENDLVAHLEEVKKLVTSPLKETIDILEKKGVVLVRKFTTPKVVKKALKETKDTLIAIKEESIIFSRDVKKELKRETFYSFMFQALLGAAEFTGECFNMFGETAEEIEKKLKKAAVHSMFAGMFHK